MFIAINPKYVCNSINYLHLSINIGMESNPFLQLDVYRGPKDGLDDT